LLQQWIFVAVRVEGVTEKACLQHRKVLLAIKKHDGATARRAMARHLKDMSTVLPEK
jgi:DNA-binding GntR family transcriptional regulator